MEKKSVFLLVKQTEIEETELLNSAKKEARTIKRNARKNLIETQNELEKNYLAFEKKMERHFRRDYSEKVKMLELEFVQEQQKLKSLQNAKIDALSNLIAKEVIAGYGDS